MIVVIPTHNRTTLLQRTVDSLAKCHRPTSYKYAIVVENGGKFGAEQIAEDAAPWLGMRYLYQEQGNKSAALNDVLACVDNELLVFLDDDVRLDENVLCSYQNASADHNDGWFFGGPTRVDYEHAPPDWLRSFLPASATGWTLGDLDQEVHEPCLLGFNWAAFASDLRRVGGFDPKVGPGGTTGARGQEASMQVELLKAGVRGLFVAEALVWHYVPVDRCSQAWALQRIYNSGMAQGMRHQNYAKAVGSVPRWMIGELLKSSLSRALFGWGTGQRAFKARYRLSKIRGNIRGVRMASLKASATAHVGCEKVSD